ncbi:MAG TPA: hypothetical protein DHV62_09385 [Elusimicrobia bacterium]|nr:hypothetical protein [Elusimicrobiota bacterium]
MNQALDQINEETLKKQKAFMNAKTAESVQNIVLPRIQTYQQPTAIIGIQFTFQNPENRKSPVLGGFKDKKEVVEGEVKEEKNKEIISKQNGDKK